MLAKLNQVMNKQKLQLTLMVLSGVVLVLNLSHINGSIFATQNLSYVLGALAMGLLAFVMGRSLWQGSKR